MSACPVGRAEMLTSRGSSGAKVFTVIACGGPGIATDPVSTWRWLPDTSSVTSLLVYGIHGDCRTIDHWKSAVLALAGEGQVRSAEKDGLGT